MLKFLADENLRKEVVGFLVQQGHDVKRPLSGTSDAKVADMARKKKIILITHDLDFSNILSFPPALYSGIIVIRIIPPSVNLVTNALNNLLKELKKEKDFSGKLIILEPAGFRIWKTGQS